MRSPQGFSACRSRPAAPLQTGTAGPSCGCTPTKARPKAQTGRNKAEKRAAEHSAALAVSSLCAGTRKNPERRRENQESGKALAPLRSARNPPNLQANSKNIPSPHQAKSTHYLMFSRMGQNERGLETKKKAGPGAGWRRGLRVDS